MTKLSEKLAAKSNLKSYKTELPVFSLPPAPALALPEVSLSRFIHIALQTGKEKKKKETKTQSIKHNKAALRDLWRSQFWEDNTI